MGELGGLHSCAGCENDGKSHRRCTKVDQSQTDEELKEQGLMRARGEHGKERIIKIVDHTLVQTLVFGFVGLLCRPKSAERTITTTPDSIDQQINDPLHLLIRGFIIQKNAPPSIYPNYGVTRFHAPVVTK